MTCFENGTWTSVMTSESFNLSPPVSLHKFASLMVLMEPMVFNKLSVHYFNIHEYVIAFIIRGICSYLLT